MRPLAEYGYFTLGLDLVRGRVVGPEEGPDGADGGGVAAGEGEGGRGAEKRTDVEALPGRVATSLLSVANVNKRTSGLNRVNTMAQYDVAVMVLGALLVAVPVVLLGTFAILQYAGMNRRRGQVTDQGQKGPQATIQGFVPLAEMFGYSTTLRSLSQGRATYSMEFKHYSEAPKNVAEAIINKK